jgi:hypothetical protein
MIVGLSIQGWFGDTVNIFVAPATGVTPPAPSLGGYLQTLEALPTPAIPLIHAGLGIALLVLGIVAIVMAFRSPVSTGVRVCTVIGALMILSAGQGGYDFVRTGLQANASSAQMGGAFILSYALYFLALYYSK